VGPKYQSIADDLRRRVAAGEFAAGRLLPSESELGGAYAASRVTVRRALEQLRDEGLVDARQGFGWFVPAPAVDQSLGRLGTIEAQLAESGRQSERQVLDFGFVRAPAAVRAVLGADRVLEVRRRNLVDGVPLARVTVWCPADLASHLSLADVERATFHELLDVELAGATQTIRADAWGGGCRGARRPGGFAGVGLRAGHDGRRRGRGPAVRARVPRAPHALRRRAGQRRPLGRPLRPPAGPLRTELGLVVFGFPESTSPDSKSLELGPGSLLLGGAAFAVA
jgi:GntR family transcriptional regulator